MTQIRLDIRPGRYQLEAVGHADYDPGHDIVCAAVSAVIWSLIGGMENTDAETVHSEQSGRVRIICRGDGEGIRGMWLMAEIGLRQIAAKYPENVEILSDVSTRKRKK